MVNYHGSQKAVLRVNPLVPLQALIPVICDKCEFDPAHVLLLKDSISRHELQLDKSLTELGIKELYVHDQSLGKPQIFVSVYVIFYFGFSHIYIQSFQNTAIFLMNKKNGSSSSFQASFLCWIQLTEK